jgi:hypothetical protein
MSVPLSTGRDASPVARRCTRLYLACSPESCVGTTLTARFLLDHALSRNALTTAFDLNHLDPCLAEVFPSQTTVVDLGSRRGQMALFDRLVAPDGVPKVVDLWHVAYNCFWSQAEDLGFFEETRRNGIDVAVFLHTDRKDRYVDQVVDISSRSPYLNVILVHNEELLGPRLQLLAHPEAWLVDKLFVVPPFDDVTSKAVKEPGILIHNILGSSDVGDVLGFEPHVHDLLGSMFKQIQLIEVGLMLERRRADQSDGRVPTLLR